MRPHDPDNSYNTGDSGFTERSTCGALVTNEKAHSEWHGDIREMHLVLLSVSALMLLSGGGA